MQSNQTIPLKPYSFQSSLDVFGELAKDVLQRTGKCKYPVGINQLDNLIWGVHKRELLVIAARPSHGKSSLLINMAWNLAKSGVGCIFLSLEMGRHSVFERIACIEFGINGWSLRQGVVAEIEKFRKIEDKMNARLLTSSLEVIDSTGKNIQEVERVLSEFKPECLFIDHVQKISMKGYGNKYEALADYVNTLQSLAVKYDCAIVLASQINRAGAGEDNAINFLKGAGDLEECADTLISCKWLCRDNVKLPDKTEYRLDVLKQRHGPTDSVSINFNGATFEFTDRFEGYQTT